VTQQVNKAGRILALLLATLPVAAAAQDAVRIGYVDMKRLLDNAPQVVAGRSRLEREFAARDAALQAEETRAGELRSRLAAGNAADADALRREMDALERSIKRKRDGLRNDLKTRSDQELDRSWREINEAVVEFAREQGYDLIVPSPVVYASPKADVTDRILDRLRRQSAGGARP
jgi:outer membrane protein